MHAQYCSHLEGVRLAGWNGTAAEKATLCRCPGLRTGTAAADRCHMFCSLARGNCLASCAAVQTGLLFCCSFLIVDVIDDRQALLFAWSGERKLGPLESTAAASTLSLAAAVALLLLFSKACLLAAWICICDDARGGVLPAS